MRGNIGKHARQWEGGLWRALPAAARAQAQAAEAHAQRAASRSVSAEFFFFFKVWRGRTLLWAFLPWLLAATVGALYPPLPLLSQRGAVRVLLWGEKGRGKRKAKAIHHHRQG